MEDTKTSKDSSNLQLKDKIKGKLFYLTVSLEGLIKREQK